MVVVAPYARMGGAIYGFANDPDYEVAFASNENPLYNNTLDFNYPELPVYNNFQFMNLSVLSNLCRNRHIDVMIGCPKRDCLSRMLEAPRADRKHKDPDSYHWLSIINYHRPNVLWFSLNAGERTLNNVLEALVDFGYSVQCIKGRLTDYGLPNACRRQFILAAYGKFNLQFRYSGDPLTIGDAIGDVNDRDEYVSDPQNFYQRWCRERPPEKFKVNARTRVRRLCAPTANHMDGIIHGLIGNCNRIGNPNNIHPTEKRIFTTREIMRLYGYPDDFGIKITPRANVNDYVLKDTPPWVSCLMAKYIKEL